MKETRSVGMFVLIAALTACDDDSNIAGDVGQQPLPEPITFSVALTGAEISRSADQENLVIDTLPIQGATVTVD